jgi:hypothetical protein
MPKYFIIEDNVVTNIVESVSTDALTPIIQAGQTIVLQTPQFEHVGIGAIYTGVGAVPFIIPTITPIIIEQDSPWEWFIDVGPFFDRFGAFKLPILINSDPGIKALITDLQVRKWVDLQNNEVAAGLAYISTIIPAFTSDIRLQILTTPVTTEENRALRKLYFN